MGKWTRRYFDSVTPPLSWYAIWAFVAIILLMHRCQ